MALRDPDLRRCWLFGPGANAKVHADMLESGADALIPDLEDFTPPERRLAARSLLAPYVAGCRQRGLVAAVRINALASADGPHDLAAAMQAGADVIAYPMAERADDIHALSLAIGHWEASLGREAGTTEILPVAETALGVVDVRAMAAASPRVKAALLGAEDLANDLAAERTREAVELDHCRRRFVVECRGARIEPIDAPYTFDDVEGAVREAQMVRTLGYRSKSAVLPAHARAITTVMTPSNDEVRRSRAIVEAFEAARSRGEERGFVDGLWVEVPTWRNAKRVLERARRLGLG